MKFPKDKLISIIGIIVIVAVCVVTVWTFISIRHKAQESSGPAQDKKRMETLKENVEYNFGEGNQADLVYAALSGDKQGFEKCLALGGDINCMDKKGRTLLSVAIFTRNKNATSLLLEHGANPNFRNGDNYGGGTALHVNTDLGDPDDPWFMETLLKYGADPNFKDKEHDDPPICNAITMGSLAEVKLLAKAGADLKYQDFSGDTLLMNAAYSNRYEIIYYLLQAGVDPKVENKFHVTLISFIQHQENYTSPDPNIDYREKVIAWLKQNNYWKE